MPKTAKRKAGRSGTRGPEVGPTRAAKPSPPERLGLGKKLAFSVLAVTLALALLEATLALIGVRPAREESDPSAGFSPGSPLFVEATGPGGAAYRVTARNRLDFFNPQRFRKQKEPGGFRIFSLGGSTTYGHPYSDPTSFNGWLRALLPAVAPGRQWELVNGGGISYGSDRVVRLMRELVRYEPDLFVIYCGHNEFLERRLHRQVARVPGALQALQRVAYHSRSAAVLLRVVRKPDPRPVAEPTPDEPVTLLDTTRGPAAYTRSGLDRAGVIEDYRQNLLRMVQLARSVGARVIFVTPVCNLKEASPFKSEPRAGLSDADEQRWRDLCQRAREEFVANASPTNALELLSQAAAIDDLPADIHFVRGRVLEKLGRFEEAKAAYERARDEDVCPLRAPSGIKNALARVATEEQVPLVALDPLVAAHSAHGIPDANIFLDHVHLTIEGYRLLALEIIRTMERAGIVRPVWDPAAIDAATRSVEGQIDNRAHSLALMNLCKTLGWAGKRDEAYRAGAQAARLGPDIAKVRYEAGLAAQLSNHAEEAIAHYRRAIELDSTLGDAHCGLAVLLEARGELADAIAHYRLALQYGKPKDAERNRANLAGALGKVPGGDPAR